MHLHSKQLPDGKVQKGKGDGTPKAESLKTFPLIEELPLVPIDLIIEMERKKQRQKPADSPRIEIEIPEYPDESPEIGEEGDGKGKKEEGEGVVIISFF